MPGGCRRCRGSPSASWCWRRTSWATGCASTATRPPSGSAMLDVEDLHTVYYQGGQGAVPAVRGVDVFIRGGSATALVGESGSGKTTAALSVMRLIRKPMGEVVRGK